MSEVPALERFFAEAGPRLDTAQQLDDELDRQLARRFNVFRYLRTDEIGSRMIADLLNPRGDHGQGAAFLQLLLAKLAMARLGFAKGVNLARARVSVSTERHIEVEIDSEHCLAIENKSNHAGDQERQVQDYLDWLGGKYSHSVLVYLSPTGDGPSERSVPRETVKALEGETRRRLVIMPCESSSHASDDEFDKLRLPFSLVDWLAGCRRNCDVDRLRWYLREAETYCRNRYGGNVVTDSKKNAIEEVIRRDEKNMATALAVYEVWPEVAREIKEKFLGLIRDSLPKDLVGHRDWEDWDSGYGEGKEESYISARRECWRPDVVIRMTHELKEHSNWFIGVVSPTTSKMLHDKLGKLNMRHNSAYGWPCWKYVEGQPRQWNSLIPEMGAELQVGPGEIAKHYVEKFKEFAKQTVPIIDDVESAE